MGRFLSADSIVPQPFNPQSLNRYTYALNNPIRYNDPTGHIEACGVFGVDCEDDYTAPPPAPNVGGGGGGGGGGAEDGGGGGGYLAAPSVVDITYYDETINALYANPVGLEPPPPGDVDIGKAIIGGVLIGLGAVVAALGVVVLVVAVPAAAAEVAVIPPVGAAHVGLAAVFGGFIVTVGVGTMVAGGYAIYTSGVIPGTSP